MHINPTRRVLLFLTHLRLALGGGFSDAHFAGFLPSTVVTLCKSADTTLASAPDVFGRFELNREGKRTLPLHSVLVHFDLSYESA